jgi:DNA repair protein RAD16
MRHYSYFNRCVLTPIQRYGYRGMGRVAYRILREQVLAKGVLRRTKEERQDELLLPCKHIVLRADELSAPELDFYNSLYHKSAAKFNKYVEKGTLLHNYAHVFDLLSSLRQACNHPYLVLLTKNISFSSYKGAGGGAGGGYGGNSMSPMSIQSCGLCNLSTGIAQGVQSEFWRANSTHEPAPVQLTGSPPTNVSSYVVAKCGHLFHRDCVLRRFARGDIASSPPPPSLHAPSMGSSGSASGARVEAHYHPSPRGPAPSDPKQGVGKEEAPSHPAPGGQAGQEEGRQGGDQGEGGRPRGKCVCPRCGEALSVDLRVRPLGFRSRHARKAARSLVGKLLAEELPTSTKLEAVVAELKQMRARRHDSKAVIFSQYTRMLDLLTIRLSEDKIAVARVTGDMTRQERDANLKAFRTDAGTSVILISLKAGGEGLNLQEADHIFVMDPWWNPASELQAIDRVHRIGQTKEVKAIRFIIKGACDACILSCLHAYTLKPASDSAWSPLIFCEECL